MRDDEPRFSALCSRFLSHSLPTIHNHHCGDLGMVVSSRLFETTMGRIVDRAFFLLLCIPRDGLVSVAEQSHIESISNQWDRESVHDERVIDGRLPSSPDCWIRSLQFINVDSLSTANACKWMTAVHQKIMALELTRCHVGDLGRQLFDQASNPYHGDTCTPENYQANLMECLTHLTTSAETAYTHFLTYINQLCTRLSQEIVMEHFYESSIRLNRASVQAEGQMREMLKGQEEVLNALNEREKEASARHEGFKHDMHLDRMRWAKESSLLRSRMHHEQEKWLQEQQLVQQSQRDEMHQQKEELRHQREELVQLSETIARANQSMQPWSINLESLYSYVQGAYHLLLWILFTTVNTFLIYFFTWPRCLRWIRRYLLFISLLGCLSQFFLAQEVTIESLFSMNDAFGVTSTVMIAFEVSFFLLGALVSPCLQICSRRDEPPMAHSSHSTSRDSLLEENQVPVVDYHQLTRQRCVQQQSTSRWGDRCHDQSTNQNQPQLVSPLYPPPQFWDTTYGVAPNGISSRHQFPLSHAGMSGCYVNSTQASVTPDMEQRSIGMSAFRPVQEVPRRKGDDEVEDDPSVSSDSTAASLCTPRKRPCPGDVDEENSKDQVCKFPRLQVEAKDEEISSENIDVEDGEIERV